LTRTLNAEQIAVTTFGGARANISISTKELLGWGRINVTHLTGGRRDRTDCYVRSFA
jgi:hypothetical protein